ncbi:MAG: hypothetical protein SFX18_15885 [Pirellulales bacterium]|nr:hypothetical protein [Pirellulales bacterium]
MDRLTERTDRNGAARQWEYDRLSRTTKENWKTAAGGSFAGKYEFSHDLADQLTEVRLNTGSAVNPTHAFTYDKRGRVTEQTQRVGARAFNSSQTFDDLDRRKTLALQSTVGGTGFPPTGGAVTADFKNFY